MKRYIQSITNRLTAYFDQNQKLVAWILSCKLQLMNSPQAKAFNFDLDPTFEPDLALELALEPDFSLDPAFDFDPAFVLIFILTLNSHDIVAEAIS